MSPRPIVTLMNIISIAPLKCIIKTSTSMYLVSLALQCTCSSSYLIHLCGKSKVIKGSVFILFIMEGAHMGLWKLKE